VGVGRARPHALYWGDMRIHHLNCGTMCPWPGRLFSDRGSLVRRGRMVCHCLLVESDAGLLLVDTGLGTADVAEPARRLSRSFVTMTSPRLRPEETALAQVARLGFAAADVRHVLPTHLDPDHAGGLSDFPEATVHLLGAEHAAAMTPATINERRRYRAAQWAHGPRWQLHEPRGGERWYGFEQVRAVAGTDDEVLLIPLFGHTRGHAGVAVRSGAGWVLHAGDSYFSRDEVHATPLHCPPGLAVFQRVMAVDNDARVANRERLRALVRQHGEVQVFSAHCPDELQACIAAEPARAVA
jgi:glyoxylase-like metal-dependent hydrolase (beta-lactamase superfamily II)